MAKKKQTPKKQPKQRFNEIGTGRIIWVEPSKVKAFKKQYKKDLEKYQKEKQKQQIETARKNFKAESYESLKENKALNFLGKKKKQKVLQVAQELDKNFVEYSLKDILKQDLNKDKTVIFDEVPNQYFYWNVQNKIDRNEFGENIEFEIYNFSGNNVYKGFDEKHVLNILDVYNKIIQRSESIITNKYNVNAYPSIGVFEGVIKDLKNNLSTQSIKIVYSIIRTKLPLDYNNEFLNLIPDLDIDNVIFISEPEPKKAKKPKQVKQPKIKKPKTNGKPKTTKTTKRKKR